MGGAFGCIVCFGYGLFSFVEIVVWCFGLI